MQGALVHKYLREADEQVLALEVSTLLTVRLGGGPWAAGGGVGVVGVAGAPTLLSGCREGPWDFGPGMKGAACCTCP